MRSFSFILLPTLLVPYADATAARKNPVSKPNVILIVADDLGYGDLSCYGATRVQTPAVDRLAARGVQFMQAHATAATSTPSRYSLLTGEYAYRKPGTQVAPGNAGMIIRAEQFTLADVFKSSGYATAALGKWHLGVGDKTGTQDWNAPLPCGPNDLGFDYTYIMAATGDRVPCVFLENGTVANYDPSAPIEVDYRKNFPGEPTGSTHPQLLTKLKPSHGHNQAVVNGISRIGFMKGGGRALWQDENIADSITLHAEQFIRSHAQEPFFMYLCTNDVHVPRYPHKRFRGKSPMGYRGDAILQFDWTVGRITALLRKLRIDENTIIVLTSDNGPVVDDGYSDRAVELLGSHTPGGALRGGKYSNFEAGTRVPFLLSWPGHVAPGKSHTLVSHIDIIASMAALCGATLPKGSAPDSYNQWPVWMGDSTAAPRSWVLEQSTALSVRTNEWKYIPRNPGHARVPWGPNVETGCADIPQLYHLATSAYETDNVVSENPQIAERLQRLVETQKLPRTNPSFNRNVVPRW